MYDKVISYGKHYIDDEDISAVIEILNSDTITQGETVNRFGKELARFTGAKYAIPVANGTAALHISASALGLQPGDEVITSPLTFCATANSVLYLGAKPVFVDVDKDTLNIDPNKIESKINKNTRAIIPVDFRGHPAPLSEIKEIADKHGLKVIEDGAHSIGSTYKNNGNKYSCGDGVHADLATFSFHPVKHITTGEGGAVLTNDDDLYFKIYNLRKHGIDRRPDMFDEEKRIGSWVYDMEMLGYNYRLTDFQSALGIRQLKKLPSIIKRRREIVNYYNSHLSNIEEFILPFEEKNVDSNFHLYIIQVKDNQYFDRYDLFNYMYSINYRPMVHYIPVHLLSYYHKKFGYKRGDFPISEEYYDRALTIPLYPSLTDSEVEKVVHDINSFVVKSKKKNIKAVK